MSTSPNGLDPGRVLITGGASGLGAAVVAAVSAAGGEPLVLDRRAPAAGKHLLVDLTDRAATEQAVEEFARDGLDAVVTCAGVDSCGPLTDVATADWDRVVEVNLLGTAAVVRAALPALLRNSGSVITVASTLGLRALPEATAYSASKFGVVGFTRALGVELGDRLRVCCLIPGGMRTAFFDDRPEKYRPAADASLMDPADVAEVILRQLQLPATTWVRELIVTPPGEPSWP